jgi:hypothetical protein
MCSIFGHVKDVADALYVSVCIDNTLSRVRHSHFDDDVDHTTDHATNIQSSAMAVSMHHNVNNHNDHTTEAQVRRLVWGQCLWTEATENNE